MDRQPYMDEALALWAEMTGIDPEKGRHLSGTLGGWETESMFRDLHEARDLDPSGVTCFMLLRAFTRAWAESLQIDAWSIVQGFPDPKDQTLLAAIQKMMALLGRPDFREEEAEFKALVRRAVASYDALREDVEAWLKCDYEMALIRRDALRSMRTLEAHQFCRGAAAPDADRPKYGTRLYEMWNMPSLVRALLGQRMPGISLVLLRDEAAPLASFFCLAVGNGENAVVLTDREAGPHPQFKHMARRPGRDLERRAAQHHFPYELLTTKSDSRGDAYVPRRNELARIQEVAIPLAEFSALAPDTVIWLALVFELVRQEYFLGGRVLPELSYTKEMVRYPHALVAADSALVKEGTYRPLDVTPRTVEDVRSNAPALLAQWQIPPVGHHQWMVDRYAAQVPAEVLNLLGREDVRALPGHLNPEKPKWDHDLERFQGTGDTEIERALAEIAVGKGHNRLLTVDPVTFGTKEAVLRDVDWTARYNLCVVIQRLADREYQATRDSIYRRQIRIDEPKPGGWFHARIHERRAWLVDAALRGSLLAPAPVPRRDYGYEGWGFRNTSEADTVEMLQVNLGDTYKHRQIAGLVIYSPSGTWNHCAVSDTVSSYWATFSPQDANGISLLTGVPVEKLPWQLQIWRKDDDLYHGNAILDRLDPAEWLLHNPWSRLGLSVSLSLGRRYANKRRKELGLPPIDWTKEG